MYEYISQHTLKLKIDLKQIEEHECDSFSETKAQELKETEEGLEGHRLWQPCKVEPVDMEKFSLVQKYLEDVHETRSVTTEASDSALGTQAAVSEIETEEISGKFTQTLAL